MQRKNHLLRSLKSTKHRSGFAMIMAIIMVVIISTILALSLSLSTQTVKRTTDIYLYEQVVLYAKSAAELALLDIAGASPCTITAPNYQFPSGCVGSNCLYDANVTIKYIYTSPSPCAVASDNYFTISTPEQNGSVLMDITVSTNPDANISSEPIRYFRRSIQKL